MIDPTSELLGVWKRWVLYSVDAEQTRDPGDDERQWGDAETADRNAVADAEMLECVLLPGTAVDGLMLDRVLAPSQRVRETVADARKALSPPGAQSGQTVRAFALLLNRIADYLRFHVDDEGRPTFRANGYVDPIEGELAETGGFTCDFVDGYSLALSVCIQTLTVLRGLEDSDTRAEISQALRGERLPAIDIDEIVKLAERRLTAAMQGLRDSFVAVPSTDDQWSYVARQPPGLDGEGLFPHGPEMDRARSQVERYLKVDLGNDRPWECGFTWGRARNVVPGHGWPALEAPYLYSTVVALDGIRDVTSQTVISSDLLTPEQAALAAELSFCASVTARHWQGLALASQPLSGIWRLEDVPWRTPDYDEDEYYTLLVARILVGDGRSGALDDPELLDRLVRVSEELAQRGRITRHPRVDEEGADDPALRLHEPGKLLRLDPDPDSDGVPVSLRIYDYAPQLLKLVAKLAQATPGEGAQERLRTVIEATWRHLAARRARSTQSAPIAGRAWASWPPQELWNMRGLNLKGGFSGDNTPWTGVNSWYMTERVVEALVALVQLRQARPGAARQSSELVDELLAELEWRIAQTAITKRAPFLASLSNLHARRTEVGVSALLGEAQELLGKVISVADTNGGS